MRRAPLVPFAVLALFLLFAARKTEAASFFVPPSNDNLMQGYVVVDDLGRYHAAYPSGSSGKIYYAFCTANCDTAAGWTPLLLTTTESLAGTQIRLQVTAAGSPRLVWFNGYTTGLRYASCSTNCTTLANWTIANFRSDLGDEQGDGHYFALDTQDRPRFIFHDTSGIPPDFNGLYYAFCDAACTAAGNWTAIRLYNTINYALNFPHVSLRYDSQNVAKMLFRVDDPDGIDPSYLAYAECASQCDMAASWVSVGLIQFRSTDDFGFHLDSNGRPRFTFFLMTTNPDYPIEQLHYAWCDSGCTSIANWGAATTGLATKHGEDVDLIFDGADRPIVGYKNQTPNAIAYARCSANCESLSGTWQEVVLETSDALNISDPIPVKPGCTLSTWSIGGDSSVALDAGGALTVLYNADHLQGGGSCFPPHRDLRRLRMVRVAGAGVGFLAAPAGFTATATSATEVALQWLAVSGAASYEVHRSTTLAGPYTVIANPTTTSALDSGRTPETTYLYKVRALGSGGSESPFGAIDPATPFVFTNADLTGITIKVVHFAELRRAVNAMRFAAGLPLATFTDPTLTQFSTIVKRAHLVELRDALNAARSTLLLPAISYVDPTVTAGVTTIKKVHVTDIRTGTQ